MDAETSQLESMEADVVVRAQAGDARAFEQLVRDYHRRAISLGYRLLGNSEDAQDVAQEAFVRAYKSLAQLDDPARFGGWFMRIVSNLALNFRRARKTRSAVSLDDMSAFGDEFRNPVTGQRKAANTDDESAAMPKELHAAITDAMDELPEQQRLALVLFSVEGMPQKEVAEVLECSIEMVKWNVFQARKKMQKALTEFL